MGVGLGVQLCVGGVGGGVAVLLWFSRPWVRAWSVCCVCAGGCGYGHVMVMLSMPWGVYAWNER